jgi:peroxiredoxin
MANRPRLLVTSLALALVVGVVGGWALSRTSLFADDGLPADDEVLLDTPGEFYEPIDGAELLAGGDALPVVDLTTVSGEVVSTAELLGTPLVVNVWFSTCPPCEREMEDFAAVHRDLGDRVRFVGVNPFDTVDTMQRFAAERGVGYELLRDPDSRFLDAVGVVSFPVTLVVASDGTVVGEYGVLDAEQLRAAIEEVV